MVELKPFKKVWKKHFSEDELEKISLSMQDFSNMIALHLFNKEMEIPKDFNQERKTFAYLETDRWDGSEGISPKQLKKLLRVWGDDFVIALMCLSLLSQKYLVGEVFEEDEDGLRIVSYKELLKKEEFQVFFKDIDDSFLFTIKTLSGLEVTAVNRDAVMALSIMFIYNNLDEDLLVLSNEEIKKDLEERWMLLAGTIPRDQLVLLAIKPEDWNTNAFLKSLDYFFGKKQIRLLTESEKISFLRFYKNAGRNAGVIIDFLGKDSLTIDVDLSQMNFEQRDIQFLERILAENQDLDFKSKLIVLKVANEERVQNIYNEHGDLRAILATQSYHQLFGVIEFRKIIELQKFNFNENTVAEMVTIFNETRNIVSTIPLCGDIMSKSYRWEVLPKSNFDSIVAGNYSQCCQHVAGVGKTCVTQGAYRENTAIFAVYKDDIMICQSFLWKAGEYIVADSIECVSTQYAEKVIKAYVEFNNFLKEHDMSLIVGNAGRIGNPTSFLSNDRTAIVNHQEFIPNIYCDAKTQSRIRD